MKEAKSMENSEWKEVKLGDVLTFQRGHDLPKTKMIKGIYPVAGSNGIIGYHSKSTTKGPGITIGRSGNIGTPHYYRNDFWAHNTVLYVKNFNGNFEQFIFYFLKTIDFTQFNTGSAVPSLNRNHVHELAVEIPPLPEQTAIASVLSSLDDKIDLLHRQNATLEKMAETLFRQWFVEEAKEEWEEVKLGDIIDIYGGYSYKGNKIGNGSSYLLGMGCVSYKDRFLYSGMRKYDEDVNEKYLVKKGDIVIATRQQSDNLPILGAPALIPKIDSNTNVIVGTNLYKVINKSNFNSYTLYKLLKCKEYENFIKSNSKGSTVRMITKDAILSFECLLPPDDVLFRLNKNLDAINIKIENNLNQIQTLTKLRDTLLPKLMSGEIRLNRI